MSRIDPPNSSNNAYAENPPPVRPPASDLVTALALASLNSPVPVQFNSVGFINTVDLRGVDLSGADLRIEDSSLSENFPTGLILNPPAIPPASNE
jgi:hypothetical protein